MFLEDFANSETLTCIENVADQPLKGRTSNMRAMHLAALTCATLAGTWPVIRVALDTSLLTRLTAAAAPINKGMKLKILPLGASIVWGQGSTDGNGFRKALRDILVANGNKDVSYVGSVRHGTMVYNACEAFPGQVIQSVANKALEHRVYTKYTPDIVLVHVGTNDCRSGTASSDDMARRFAWLLDSIRRKSPNAFVLASTLIPNLDPRRESCIQKYNARLPAVVEKARKGGQKVALVDMHAAVPRSQVSKKDKTHPTDEGYKTMARAWYHALVKNQALLRKEGMIAAVGKG